MQEFCSVALPIKVKTMNMESLANELLLDLFKYITGVDLLRAFYGLNARFNALLFTQFRGYCLDFRSVSKHDFDIVCQEHLPSILGQVIALCLSDDDETPGQTGLFLSRVLTLRPFTSLRSLSLYDLDSKSIMNKMLNELYHLLRLTHLHLTYIPAITKTSLSIFNSIWSLPKLTHFYMRLKTLRKDEFPVPTVISSSLEDMSIENLEFSFHDLACLLEQTPHLRRICVRVVGRYADQELPFVVPLITRMNLYFSGSYRLLTNLLQNMPNLCYLIIETHDINMDGHRWEEIIVNHLQKLKLFRFKMQFKCGDINAKEQEVDQLLNSFRSNFWLNERQCFVRCHWYSFLHPFFDTILLYSLPYGFADFNFDIQISAKSTCSRDDDYWSYDRVHSMRCCSSISQDLILRDLYFPNIHHLNLQLPFDTRWWSLFPKLDQLTSLDVIIHGQNSEAASQLQMLLDRAPHLYSLKLDSPSTLQVCLAKLTSASVRRIDFYQNSRYVEMDEQITLMRSSLGIHCQVLRINVSDALSIINITNTMSNLRALNVTCGELAYVEEARFDKWWDRLKDRLPSTCRLPRDERIYGKLRLWIR